jgi:tetratricopeptide (TPR) repeat protein
MMNRSFAAAVAAALLAAGCASHSGGIARQHCADADSQLSTLLMPLEEGRGAGCAAWPADCDNLRREIERLALICPGHAPTLLTNAVIAYEGGQTLKAQQFLDRIFERPGSHPDAAILRARIAIEEGNIPFARRFLEEQILLAPDQAVLRETHAGVLYLAGDGDRARTELNAASELGAPRWRIAYHLGLIEEAQGRMDAAKRFYTEAIAGNPDFAAAKARLNGLGRGAK